MVVSAVVTGTGGANNRSRRGQCRNTTCILDGPAGKNIGGLVILFIPGLIVFITKPEVEPRRKFKIVLKISREAPLAVPHPAERRCQLDI